MNLPNEINKYWNYLEEKYPSPRYVKKVKKLNFSKLKKEIDNKNYKYIKKLIRKMFVEKEAYILKNSADKNLKNTIIQLANYYKKNKKTSFYKMIDGVPNFHRVIDKNITKKYSLFSDYFNYSKVILSTNYELIIENLGNKRISKYSKKKLLSLKMNEEKLLWITGKS